VNSHPDSFQNWMFLTKRNPSAKKLGFRINNRKGVFNKNQDQKRRIFFEIDNFYRVYQEFRLDPFKIGA